MNQSKKMNNNNLDESLASIMSNIDLNSHPNAVLQATWLSHLLITNQVSPSALMVALQCYWTWSTAGGRSGNVTGVTSRPAKKGNDSDNAEDEDGHSDFDYDFSPSSMLEVNCLEENTDSDRVYTGKSGKNSRNLLSTIQDSSTSSLDLSVACKTDRVNNGRVKKKLSKVAKSASAGSFNSVLSQVSKLSGKQQVEEPKKNRCEECNKSFGKKETLKEHLDHFHSPQNHNQMFFCQICDRKFSWRKSWQKHHRDFHGDNPIQYALIHHDTRVQSSDQNGLASADQIKVVPLGKKGRRIDNPQGEHSGTRKKRRSSEYNEQGPSSASSETEVNCDASAIQKFGYAGSSISV